MRNKIKRAAACAAAVLTLTTGMSGLTASARTYSDFDAMTSGISLSIPTTLAFTQPGKNITTSSASYFLTGSSNPNQTLTINGTEITNRGVSGSFGVLVELQNGANQFTAQQGGQSAVVVITRQASSGGSTGPGYSLTDVLTKPYPAQNSYGVRGNAMDLSCIAPSGASVTATVDGKTFPMTQVAATAVAGVPARFKGTAVSNSGSDTSVKKIGKVRYTMVWKGKTTTYDSQGELYLTGKNISLVVEVDNSSSNVFATAGHNYSLLATVLRRGSRDSVMEQTDDQFKLSLGGWIDKKDVKILEGSNSAFSSPKSILTQRDGRKEQFIFSGMNNPSFVSSMTDEKFSITFHNTSNISSLPVKTSAIFSSYGITSENNNTTLTFTKRAADSIWGWDVAYDGQGNTVLTLTAKPSLSSDPNKPLTGLIIALDPGHGKSENGGGSGASGLLNGYGPREEDMTYAQAQITKRRLESLGATVVMTRDEKTDPDLTERDDIAMAANADLFLSVHINSFDTVQSPVTGSKAKGTEVFTHETMGMPLASQICSKIASYTGRTNRGAKYSNYKVTMYTYAPSLLLELGFICNPAEYDDMCSQQGMYQTANAIADGILASLGGQ